MAVQVLNQDLHLHGWWARRGRWAAMVQDGVTAGVTGGQSQVAVMGFASVRGCRSRPSRCLPADSQA